AGRREGHAPPAAGRALGAGVLPRGGRATSRRRDARGRHTGRGRTLAAPARAASGTVRHRGLTCNSLEFGAPGGILGAEPVQLITPVRCLPGNPLARTDMNLHLAPAIAGLGPTELIIIFAVIVLLFGASKLPDLARGSGRALRIFKAETKGLSDDDDDTSPEELEPRERRDGPTS